MGAKLSRPGRLADRDKTDAAAWDCPKSESNANRKVETSFSFVLTLERAGKWWLDSGFPFGSPCKGAWKTTSSPCGWSP
jgi:hypothetical protein